MIEVPNLDEETVARCDELWNTYINESPDAMSQEDYDWFMGKVEDYSILFLTREVNRLIIEWGVPREATNPMVQVALMCRLAGGMAFYNFNQSHQLLKSVFEDQPGK